jgi:beta-galactosidase
VVGFRTGYADQEARARAEAMPGRLREAVGASYGEYTNLVAPVPVTAVDPGDLTLPEGARATAWADALVPEGAATVLAYDHPHLGRWAAVTTRGHGAGRVTYVGTLPNRELAVALARWLAPATGASAAWSDRPEAVTVTGARNSAGERVRFVSNWSWDPATITLPIAVQDLLSGEPLVEGQQLELSAWDVRVLLERSRAVSTRGEELP